MKPIAACPPSAPEKSGRLYGATPRYRSHCLFSGVQLYLITSNAIHEITRSRTKDLCTVSQRTRKKVWERNSVKVQRPKTKGPKPKAQDQSLSHLTIFVLPEGVSFPSTVRVIACRPSAALLCSQAPMRSRRLCAQLSPSSDNRFCRPSRLDDGSLRVPRRKRR
jgi:hypothetical protein